MSTANDDGKPPETTESIKQEGAACCESGCGCGTAAIRSVAGVLLVGTGFYLLATF